MAHQYMPKIFRDPNKHPSALPPTYLMYGSLASSISLGQAMFVVQKQNNNVCSKVRYFPIQQELSKSKSDPKSYPIPFKR